MNSKTKSTLLLVLLIITFIICSTLVLIISIDKSESNEVYADTSVSYISRSWDDTNKVVVETPSTCETYTIISSDTITWNTGWYVVNSDVTITGRILCSGTVNLILCDGKTLTSNSGITVTTDYTLNIYGQSLDTGSLVATAANSSYPIHNAGIGGANASGNNGCGTINFYGGSITVNSVDNSYGAAIGAVSNHDGGRISVYGGTVNANPNNATTYGAGIGGSGNYAAETIDIYGGSVTARSYYGAGIGGGKESNGCTVTISGGEVFAIGGIDAAGIGGGPNKSNGTLTTNLDVLGSNTDNPPTTIQTNYTSTRWKYMIVKRLHEHNWSYEANGASITATCLGSGDCPETSGLILTLQAPNNLTYNGSAKTATIVAGYNAEAFPSPSITYYSGTDPITNCINVGEYRAEVTFSSATAQVSFEIEKANPTYTAPTAITNLVYTGDEQELINAGTASNGEMQYKLSANGTYSTSIPGAINAGDYIVYYKVVGDSNHNDIAETPIEVSIAKIDSSISTTPTAISNLVYAGNAQVLVNAGTATGGTIYYKIGQNGAYGDAIPVAANAGDYDVYYKVIGDGNHNDIDEAGPIQISIAKANPTYTVPTNIEAPYGATLSTVILPEGFAWMDGTQKVNNWKANIFKARYTPADTANYNVIENIDIQVAIKWIIVDPEQNTVNVEIDDGETNFDVSITVKVEVKTELSVEAKQTNYANLAKGFVAKDEDISAIYGVRLIRTTNGVEEEIQPSDIKEGQKIKISMAIPEALQGKEFRLLHIHSAEDISEVSKEHYAISADRKTLIIETDKLSEFAFVSKTDSENNGFIYDEPSTGFKYWWIIVIVAVVLIICLLLFIFFKRKKDNADDSNKTNEQPKVEQPNVDDNKEEAIAQTEAEAEEELESSKESDVEEIEAKEKAHEAITLKDSLTLAKATSSSHTFNKKYVADYLRTKDIVEVNERDNYTKTGLPLADTHYVDGKEGKKCFAYVYETEGSIILLAKMDDEYAKSLQKNHSQINKSAFPKQKNTWYSLIIDDTYSEEEFEGILDELIGEVKEDAGMSLKESIALAKASTSQSFSKKYVCEYLKDKENVEVNTRDNYTKTGLPLADTHYVEKDGKHICFAYVYEIEGSIILLAKMNTKYAKELQKKHKQINLSAFPKQADTWYSLIIDDTYSKAEFDKMIEDLMDQA